MVEVQIMNIHDFMSVEEGFSMLLSVKFAAQDLLPVWSTGEHFMSQNPTYYTSLERSYWVESPGTKFGANGQFYGKLWPVKVVKNRKFCDTLAM